MFSQWFPAFENKIYEIFKSAEVSILAALCYKSFTALFMWTYTFSPIGYTWVF